MALIAAFGFASSADTDKFAQAAHRFDAQGMPYVTQDACARFACRVTDVIDAGTHLLFIGEVTQAERLSDAPPMTYAYYHAVKKGTTPPKASSYQPAPGQSRRVALHRLRGTSTRARRCPRALPARCAARARSF